MRKTYKLFLLGLLSTWCISSYGQKVVFSEDFGGPGEHKKVNAVLSPYMDWENSDPIVFSHGEGGVYIDDGTPSSGYASASGNAYIVLQSPDAATPENVFYTLQIDGINTAGLDSISLSFGFYSMAAADDGGENLSVYMSSGEDWVMLTSESTFPAHQEWGWVTFGTGDVIPSTGSMSLKFMHNGTADVAFFIDDVTLERPTSMDASIWSFSLGEDEKPAAKIGDEEIMAEVFYGTDLSSIEPAITIHPYAGISPTGPQDFSGGPVIYTVTAEDGTTVVNWEVTITEGPAPYTAEYDITFAEADSNFITYTTSGKMDDQFEAWYKTFWTDTALHVFVHVEDSNLVNTNEGFDQNDYIDIFVDMDQAFPYVENRDNGSWWNTYDKNDAQIGFHRDDDVLIQIGTQYSGRLITTDDVSFTVSEVDGGNAWELEAVIMFDGLDPMLDVFEGRELGFEVVVGDADTAGINHRDGRAAWFGSGDNPWQHPRLWGTLVLGTGLQNDNTDIMAFSIEGQRMPTMLDDVNFEIEVELPYSTDVTALEPEVVVHEASTVYPASGTATDFTNPVTYTVTAQDASTQDWTVTVMFGPAPDTAKYDIGFEAADSNFITYTTSGKMDDQFEAWYKTFYTDTALHVFVHVEDSNLVNTNEGFDQNDYIDIFVDMDMAYPYVNNQDNGSWWNTYDKNDAQIGFHRDDDALIQIGTQYSGRLITTDDVSFTVSEVDGGNAWELEAVIMFEGLDPGLDVFEGRKMGFEVVVGDADTDTVGAQRDGRAAWYAPTDNPWQHPRLWGTLVLGTGLQNDNTDIMAFSIEGQRMPTMLDDVNFEIEVELPFGTDVTAPEPEVVVHEASTVSPASGVATDFTNPVTYTVTAQDATTQDWTVTVTLGPAPDTSVYNLGFAAADSNFITYTTSGMMDEEFDAYYKTFWSDTALHVFVHVDDPELVNTNEGFDQNDYIDIFVDMDRAFPYVENSDNGSWWNTYDKNDAQIGFQRDNDTLKQIGTQYSGRLVTADDVSFTVTEVTGGWELEAIIEFEGMDPDVIVGNKLELGFEVVVGDADVDTVGAGREGRAAWYAPTDNPWQHPRNWGTLVLKGGAASDDAMIYDVMMDELNMSDTAVVIDPAKDTVILTVQYGTDVTALEPILTLHPAATVDVTGDQDFTNPVAYTVTAEDASTRVWDIAVDIEIPNSAKLITKFTVPDQLKSTIDNGTGTIEVVVAYVADVSALVPTIVVSPDATVIPASGVVRDFTLPVSYTVTAEDGTMKDYIVTMKRAPGLVDSKIGSFDPGTGKISKIWTDSTTVGELIDSLVLSDNADSALVLLVAGSTKVANGEFVTSAMFLRVYGADLYTDYGLVVTAAPQPPVYITGFVENFDNPATVDMTMWDVNQKPYPEGGKVFVVTHDVAAGALKIVMNQAEFPDGLMFNLSKYILDLTNTPLAQMTIKVQDATYAGVTTLSIPIQLNAFSFWGGTGRRLGQENIIVDLDATGSTDPEYQTLFYDFRVGDAWQTDSAGIDSTQYILFETVKWPSTHTATFWIDEIRLGDSAAPYVPSSEAEILATTYGILDAVNYMINDIPDTLTVTEVMLGLTISDKASAVMLVSSGGVQVSKPERTAIDPAQVIKITAEDGTIQEYTVDTIHIIIEAIDDIYDFDDVAIYPNPVSNILYLENVGEFERIVMTNIVGQVVMNMRVTSEMVEIHVGQLEKGVYFLNLHSKQYGTLTRKVIVK